MPAGTAFLERGRNVLAAIRQRVTPPSRAADTADSNNF